MALFNFHRLDRKWNWFDRLIVRTVIIIFFIAGLLAWGALFSH